MAERLINQDEIEIKPPRTPSSSLRESLATCKSQVSDLLRHPEVRRDMVPEFFHEEYDRVHPQVREAQFGDSLLGLLYTGEGNEVDLKPLLRKGSGVDRVIVKGKGGVFVCMSSSGSVTYVTSRYIPVFDEDTFVRTEYEDLKVNIGKDSLMVKGYTVPIVEKVAVLNEPRGSVIMEGLFQDQTYREYRQALGLFYEEGRSYFRDY